MTNLTVPQAALLAVYTPGPGGTKMRADTTALIAPYAPPLTKGFVNAQTSVITAFAPTQSHNIASAQEAVLAAYATDNSGTPKIAQVAAMAVWANFVAAETRTWAWPYILDGHTNYVLDLGQEGTFIYDTVTQQWSQSQTEGFVGWNMRNGTMFDNNRIAGGDNQSGFIWELDPDELLDEGFRDITHMVTGGVPTRSRSFLSCDALRLTISAGTLVDVTGATLSLRFSDDQGKTWIGPYTVTLTENTFNQDIAFRSLGSFMAPGRIFEISDVGGPVRIDGADVFIDGFDASPGQQSGG